MEFTGEGIKKKRTQKFGSASKEESRFCILPFGRVNRFIEFFYGQGVRHCIAVRLSFLAVSLFALLTHVFISFAFSQS